MGKQKVITCNINISDLGREDGYKEFELELLNKYLDEGYSVVDKFSTVTNSKLLAINITFILEKE